MVRKGQEMLYSFLANTRSFCNDQTNGDSAKTENENTENFSG
jgi:hypothetical protein